MKLGKYFTLEELTVTNSSHDNTPNRAQILSLSELVKNVLDPVREEIGMPIKVNSGFRSFEVNKSIGGALTSQHTKGEAADLDCSDNAKLFNLIHDNLVFDQLIWEGGDDKQPAWVHVSYKTTGNRGEALRMTKVNGKSTYKRI